MEKFKSTEYDLAQNLLKNKTEGFEERVVKLKMHALILSIAYVFKYPEMMKALENWIKVHLKFKKAIKPTENEKQWNKIELTVEYEIDRQCHLKYNNMVHVEIPKEVIRFMGLEIYYHIIGNKCPYTDTRTKLANLCFNSYSTINLIKTLDRMLKTNSIKDKLIPFAYYYFKEEIIQKVSVRQGGEREKCLNFWIRNFVENENKVNIKFEEKCQKVFLTAVERNNKIVVQYLWINYISKISNRKQVLKTALMKAVSDENKTNICMYFLFQINCDELDFFFKSNRLAKSVIENVIKIVRWRRIFFLVLSVLKKYLTSANFVDVFDTLNDSYSTDYINKVSSEIVIQYFGMLDRKCKKEIVDADPTKKKRLECYSALLKYSFIAENKDYVEILLEKCDTNDVKNTMCSKVGINSLIEVMKRGKLEFFVEVLKPYFSSNDINSIRGHLSTANRNKILNELEEQGVDIFLNFFDWINENDPNKKWLRKEQIFRNQGSFIKQTLFFETRGVSYDDRLQSTDEILLRFLDSMEAVSSFKKDYIFLSICKESSLKCIPCYEPTKNCLLQSEWDFLEKFFNWKVSSSNDKNSLVKRLVSDMQLIQKILQKDEILNFLTTFVGFLKKNCDLKRNDEETLKIKVSHCLVQVNLDSKVKEELITWCTEEENNEEFSDSETPTG